VQNLLTEDDFVNRAVGVPWVRWRSDWDAVDCFGTIVLWHREVLGVDLGPVPQIDIADGFSLATGWVECGPEEGATCFMAWRHGAPTHCGIMLTGRRVLHCEGSEERAGSVRVTPLVAMRRVYGEIRFYRRAAC